MVKEMPQQKELIAKVRYDERISKDPNDLAWGAQLFGNRPGLARNMPDGLQEFTIHLVPGATPVRQGMLRFTAEETLEIRKQVTKMLEAGVIEACHSPFASGVVLAREKDGTFRFAVDLRKLNIITAEPGDDVWNLPRFDDCLRKCSGMHWFTLIDARSAFWSIPLARASRQRAQRS
jgi:hypothetical protein